MIPRTNSPNYKLGLRYLGRHEDGLTATELAELVGIAKRNMNDHIRIYRDLGLVRIVRWRSARGGGNHSPVYGISDPQGKKDTKKPKPLSGAIKQKRYRTKFKDLIAARMRFKRTGKTNHFGATLTRITKGKTNVESTIPAVD